MAINFQPYRSNKCEKVCNGMKYGVTLHQI